MLVVRKKDRSSAFTPKRWSVNVPSNPLYIQLFAIIGQALYRKNGHTKWLTTRIEKATNVHSTKHLQS